MTRPKPVNTKRELRVTLRKIRRCEKEHRICYQANNVLSDYTKQELLKLGYVYADNTNLLTSAKWTVVYFN